MNPILFNNLILNFILGLILISSLSCKSRISCEELPISWKRESTAFKSINKAEWDRIEIVKISKNLSSEIFKMHYYECNNSCSYLMIDSHSEGYRGDHYEDIEPAFEDKFYRYYYQNVPSKTWQLLKETKTPEDFIYHNIKGIYNLKIEPIPRVLMASNLIVLIAIIIMIPIRNYNWSKTQNLEYPFGIGCLHVIFICLICQFLFISIVYILGYSYNDIYIPWLLENK